MPLTSSSLHSDERLRRVLLIALCVFSALLGRLCYLARPFDSDGAIFVYQGKLVSEGGRYVHDFIDNKFPTVGLMTSFFWRICGAWWPGYVISGAIMSAIACFFVARSARRSFGPQAALPACLMAIVYLNFNSAVFGGFQLETIQVLFTVIAASAALDALFIAATPASPLSPLEQKGDAGVAATGVVDAFLVGLACGCAAMVKPTGLSVLAAFAIVAIWQFAREPRRLIKLLLAAACGFAIPLLVSLTYLIAADNLRDLPALYRQIKLYAANSAWRWSDISKPLIVLSMLGFPFVVRGRIFRREHDRAATDSNHRAIAFLLIWLALETIGVVAQRRMYAYHFLVLAAPAALLFGALPRRDRAVPLFLALAPMAIFSIYGGALTIELTYRARQRMEVSDYLTTHAFPGDSVWQDDYPRLLIETNLRPGSRYPLTFLFANYDSAPLDYTRGILDDFHRDRPKYLVFPCELDRYIRWHANNILEFERFPIRQANYYKAWNQIRQFVSANYTVEAKVGTEQVWRRVERPAAQAAAR